MKLQDITFDYGVLMKAALFKSNVNEIVFLLGKSLMYDRPEVQEEIRTRFGPS